MKFSTIMSVAAVSLALAASGCKYSKAGSEAGAGSGEAASAAAATDIESDVEAVDIADTDSTGGSLDQLLGASGNFEDMYQRCTDVAFAPVYFGFDSTVVPQGELGKIEAVAGHLAENENRVVVIEGNCDERGSNEYNLSLGENRAKIVRNYLVQNGIGDDRIQTRSYGEERPAVQGSGEEVWSKNRRGEFAIFQK